MNKIRVLIVDDSIFMRQALTKILNSDEIEIIDTAKNGKEGVEKTLALAPDIVTMDIEMPVMNGIESLKEIMHKYPVPVLMVSNSTIDGAEATVDALNYGAIDFIAKPSSIKDTALIGGDLINKITSIGRNSELKNNLIRKRLLDKIQTGKNHVGKTFKSHDAAKRALSKSPKNYKNRPAPNLIKAIGIGISTGGPKALKQVLPGIDEDFPVPIFISQHMPEHFTKSLAVRLDGISKINIVEAEDLSTPQPGTAYIAPGGKQMILKRGKIRITDEPEDSHYKPSVNVMMHSLIAHYGKRIVGLMMTGMGNDGLEAFQLLYKRGGYIMTQDEQSCIVAGMPRAVMNANIVNEIHALDDIAGALCTLFK